MVDRGSLAIFALAAALCAAASGVQAWDDATYPNWKGQWVRASPVQWDPTKPPARRQQAPLTEEYQAIYESRLAEQEIKRGQDYNPQVRCMPPGMPRAMIAYEPFELIVTPAVTYMRMEYMLEFRRIYTDGRDWPAKLEPSFMGTSIGRWIDEDGDGRYDVLEVETRGFRGPRLVENTGIPLHVDNQTITKERIYLDKAKGDTLYDQVTIIDHAFTRPWTVTRAYSRDAKPVWTEFICHEHNTLIIIKGETYFIREDGYLMPSRKDQVAPDLRKFEETRAER